MSIETENSYIFTHDGVRDFLLHTGNAIAGEYVELEDRYLAPGLRIRAASDGSTGEKKWFITKKAGDKSSGSREEHEHFVSSAPAEMMSSEAKLVVKKRRHSVITPPSVSVDFQVTVDFVQSPMRIAVLEVESTHKGNIQGAVDVLFQEKATTLRPCPLDAWRYFKRRIGICGGPSAGKTETARKLSYDLNTQLSSNSFHVTEYATSFIQKYNRNPTIGDQFFVWFGQREREANAASRADIVVSDCPTFLSYIYAKHMNAGVFDERLALFMSKMYKRVLFDLSAYSDIVFLRQVDYHNNGIRFQTESEAQKISDAIFTFLREHRVAFMYTDYRESGSLLRNLFYIN